MSGYSETECRICYELIRYGQPIETVDIWDEFGGKIPVTAHAECADTYVPREPTEDNWDDDYDYGDER